MPGCRWRRGCGVRGFTSIACTALDAISQWITITWQTSGACTDESRSTLLAASTRTHHKHTHTHICACTCKSTVQQNSPISNNHIFITHARYSTNHLQITVPQWRPVIDFWPRARATAATVYNCTGINIPGQIGQVITRYPSKKFFFFRYLNNPSDGPGPSTSLKQPPQYVFQDHSGLHFDVRPTSAHSKDSTQLPQPFMLTCTLRYDDVIASVQTGHSGTQQ